MPHYHQLENQLEQRVDSAADAPHLTATPMSRALTILYTLDSFVLALITMGRCQIGDTLSSKAWQLEQKGRLQGRIFRPVIDWLFSDMEADHCKGAYKTFLRITGAQR